MYALGLLLFRLLAGLLPSSRSIEAIAPILLRLSQEETEKPSARLRPIGVEFSYPQSALKGDLDAIVAQALRMRPEDRYGSVVEFSADIERYLSAQAVQARVGVENRGRGLSFTATKAANTQVLRTDKYCAIFTAWHRRVERVIAGITHRAKASLDH